jgi:hypothetical protein
MPKTWNDGPPRSETDSWTYSKRGLVNSLAAGIVSCVRRSKWEHSNSEAIDAALAISESVISGCLNHVGRTDGKDWSEPPRNEEDAWAFERAVEMSRAALSYLVPLILEAEAWSGGITDEQMAECIRFSAVFQAKADTAYPRIG